MKKFQLRSGQVVVGLLLLMALGTSLSIIGLRSVFMPQRPDDDTIHRLVEVGDFVTTTIEQSPMPLDDEAQFNDLVNTIRRSDNQTQAIAGSAIELSLYDATGNLVRSTFADDPQVADTLSLANDIELLTGRSANRGMTKSMMVADQPYTLLCKRLTPDGREVIGFFSVAAPVVSQN